MAHLCIQHWQLWIKWCLVSGGETKFGTLYHSGDLVCHNMKPIRQLYGEAHRYQSEWLGVWCGWSSHKHPTDIQPTFYWWSKCFNEVWNIVITFSNCPCTSSKNCNVHGVNTIKCLMYMSACSDSHYSSNQDRRFHWITNWCERRHSESCQLSVQLNSEQCARWYIPHQFHVGCS